MTAKLLQQWGFEGYVRWLRGIKSTYRMRKTWMCDTFDDFFHLEFDENTNGVSTNSLVQPVLGVGRGVTCYAKPIEGSVEAKWDEKRGMTSKRGPPLVSFIPPTAGMFVFLAVHIDQHPDWDALERKGEDATKVLMMKLWQTLADDLVSFQSRLLYCRLTPRSSLLLALLSTPMDLTPSAERAPATSVFRSLSRLTMRPGRLSVLSPRFSTSSIVCKGERRRSRKAGRRLSV